MAILLPLLSCLLSCSRSSISGTIADTPPALFRSLSPIALVAAPGSQTLYIACATANQVLVFNTAQRQITRRLAVPGSPSGLALSADGRRLFVTCAAPDSQICLIDALSSKLLKVLPAGHTALSPVLSRDEKTLFVCNRFNNAISLFDLRDARQIARIQVSREPVSAALTRDGRFLLVANHLPSGRSDVTYVAATVSVIDLAARKVVKELRLPNGSINLRELSISPDGKYACLAHTVGRFQLPVTQLQQAWVNASTLTLIDLDAMEVLNTVIVDDVDRGTANPWAVAWSADNRLLCVTHAGTHELSLIDFPGLLRRLAVLPATPPPPSVKDGYLSSRCQADVPNDLSFLSGLRRRVKLNGNGPRALAIANGRAFVAGYFSDSLDVLDLSPAPLDTHAGRRTLHTDTASAASPPQLQPEAISLNPGHELTTIRRGEMCFNDATLCFQGWQSCASCHDDDARVDGVNWDLLNDGIGNPKDTKSLVLSHQTPPVMSLGVRSTAALAVRQGILNSLASVLPEDVPAAMDEWLKSLKPAPSPFLVSGRFSEAAQRGEQLFKSSETGCVTCHEPELFTDLRPYAVGTENPFDKQDKEFDTPTLSELWRTAPYLHDGSASTVREVLTTCNPKDQHGKTSHLTAPQLDDLAEYLLSL